MKRSDLYFNGDQGEVSWTSYPKTYTLGTRLGFDGLRRSWDEQRRKREGKEEWEGWSKESKEVKSVEMRAS